MGTEKVAGNSWSRSQTVHVSEVVVGIVGNPGVKVGFDGNEIVEGNTAVSVELGEAAVVAGTAERAGVQGRGERKVGAGRWLVVGIANTVAQGGEEEVAVLVVDVGVGRAVAGVGVAAAASRTGYHHNRSSHIGRTVQQEDAVGGLVGEGSIASYKFRNLAAERGCGLQRQTSRKNNPSEEGVEGEDQGVEVGVVDCTMAEVEKDFFA